MDKLKVMIVTSKFPRYENDPQPPFVFYFGRELVKMGHDVIAISPHDKDAKNFETLSGIRIYRHQYFWPASLQKLSYGPGIPANVHKSLLSIVQMPFFVFSQALKSFFVSRKEKPDIIHAHWAFPQGLSAMATGKPYITTFYGGEFFLAKKFKLMWMLDWIVSKSKASFTVTNGYVRLMKEMGLKKTLGAIPLGVDTDRFYPNVKGSDEIRKKFVKKGELMVLCVGRHVEKKGINYLVESFPAVIKAVPKARLVIVGTGPMEAMLKRMASELGISDKVIFTGEIVNTDLPKYFCAADIFVLPSIVDRHGDREGQGVVYLEAMACAKPVIGTNTGGIPDVISKDVGFLVEQKNPVELSASIIKLLKSESLRKKMGQKAYKHVQNNFTWKEIARKYVDVYRGILNENPRN